MDQTKSSLTQKQNNQIADIILSAIPSIKESVEQFGLTKSLPEYVQDAGYELSVSKKVDKTIVLIILKDGKEIVREYI